MQSALYGVIHVMTRQLSSGTDVLRLIDIRLELYRLESTFIAFVPFADSPVETVITVNSCLIKILDIHYLKN